MTIITLYEDTAEFLVEFATNRIQALDVSRREYAEAKRQDQVDACSVRIRHFQSILTAIACAREGEAPVGSPLHALQCLLECFNDEGEITKFPSTAQAYPVEDPLQAVSVLDYARSFLP